MNRNAFAFLPVVLALASSVVLATPAHAQFTLVKISTDKFHNSDSVHRTEVEPDFFSWGNTIVGTFHVARVPGTIGWGSADVGWSTSTDGGKTWTYGILPGLTKHYKGGRYGWAADPSVAYDAKHGQWLISTLPLAGQSNSGLIGDVAVSRSSDGIHWGKPIIIDATHEDDKNWTTCDNTPTSPFYGNCYTEWDQIFGSRDVLMSTSSDGGLTWGPGKPSADHAAGLGGEPVVQPNGTVIVPFLNGGIDAFRSTDGGKTWSSTVTISTVDNHGEDGNFRSFADLPSAGIDAAGKVYVVWWDCRFRSGCGSNDIVMSTSTDGRKWSAVSRIPIDPIKSTVDHFIAGIGVDPATSGSTGHLTIVYYYYPVSACNNSCKLDVGFVTSQDGGKTWTKGKQLAGPMQLSWLPVSDAGYMVADYIGVTYNNGNPFGLFMVAKAPSGGLLNEAAYTTKEPLLAASDEPRFSSKGEKPVPGAKSDHEMKFYFDDEGRFPIPPSRLIPPPKQK
ncbi:MAG TPA: sialidase family protein [Terriglobales bacterium]|nr:sialidase family protein [Terriglobales bacterium]